MIPGTSSELCARLRLYRFPCGDEAELQRAIALALESEGIAFQREVKRGLDRIDFLAGRIGIECKVDGAVSQVTRQLFRYALWEDIDELVCATSVGRHKLLPRELSGKAIHVLVIRGMF